jgi:hypothetical protein
MEESMKKIAILAAILTFAVSGSAFAAALATGGVTTAGGQTIYGGLTTAIAASATAVIIGKTSNGVILGANYTTAAYAIDTKHTSGSMAYGTANDATAIYKTELGVGANLTAPSSASYSSFSLWTAM